MISRIRGTEDILPQDAGLWRYVEETARELCRVFGYGEIRTPIFENTELFSRGVGDTTDVVQKEMYTFLDKGGRSMTLKPEGTATLVRSYIENSLYANPQPTKLYYIIPCFRYEKPQAGRLREFHQFGIECFGASSAKCDAEIIALAMTFLDRLGIKGLKLNINNIGCPECRARYNEKLVEYFTQYKDKLCTTCLGRLEKNPMRIIDCKSDVCGEIAKDAPRMLDYLCDECSEHFEETKVGLDNLGIDYNINPNIVRGLDYYTKTVFEIIADIDGSSLTVCGGGRYNGLVEQLGGKPTEGIGFAAGIERLVMLMKAQGLADEICGNVPEIYIGTIGSDADKFAQKLIYDLRMNGVYAENDLLSRSVKAQMKYANKIGAKYSMILGDDEVSRNTASLKNMDSGEEVEVQLSADKIIECLKNQEVK